MARAEIVSGKENAAVREDPRRDDTGGTEGAKTIYEQFAISGVSTVVGMHIEARKLLRTPRRKPT